MEVSGLVDIPIARWFIRGNPMKMDDEQGYPYFRKTPYSLQLNPSTCAKMAIGLGFIGALGIFPRPYTMGLSSFIYHPYQHYIDQSINIYIHIHTYVYIYIHAGIIMLVNQDVDLSICWLIDEINLLKHNESVI